MCWREWAWLWACGTALLLGVVLQLGDTKCSHYGGCHHKNPFLPAPPGETPPCAKGGDTYCENVYHYPKDQILYLLQARKYDFDSLISDESMEEFMSQASTPTMPPDYSPPYYSQPAPQYQHHSPPMRTGMNFSYTQQPFLPRVPVTRYEPPKPQYQTPYYYTALVTHKYPTPPMWWDGRYSGPPPPRRDKRQTSNQLCPTQASFIMPKAGLNNKGNWMFLINMNEVDEKYTQLVRAEKCRTTRCEGVCSFPEGFQASCQQQYVQKRLVALDGSGQKLLQEQFWFPHCCVCQVKSLSVG